MYQKKSRFLRTRLAKDCQKVGKGLPIVCWGSKKHGKDSGSRVSVTRLFLSYGHFVMAYANGCSELYSTADKERSESQKGRSDFSSVLSVSVVQTLENKIRFDTNFACKRLSERSKDRHILFYTINSMQIKSKRIIERKKNKEKERRGRREKIIKKGKNSPGGTTTDGFRIAFRLQVQKRYHWTNLADDKFCVKMSYINMRLKPITEAKVINFLYRVSLQKTFYT